MNVKATDLLLQLFKRADAEAEDLARRANTTCRRGCHHCCKLLVTCGIADGHLLAEEILSRIDWEDWVKRLVEAAKKHCYKGIDKMNWFKKKEPCVFLKDGECGVYEKRPAACRYHYVISPPENCSPDMPVTTKTAILNFIGYEQATSWEVSARMSPTPYVGPLPLMVLFCMMATFEQDDPRKMTVLNYIRAEHLPTPMQWIMDYSTPPTPEEMEEFSKALKNEELDQVDLAPPSVIPNAKL